MVGTVLGALALTITVMSGVMAFGFARGFIRRRLRFVDSVRSPLTPVIAGAVALLVAWPFLLLPLVTKATAIVFSLGAGFGARSGVKALERGDPA
jgi:hypothetical protein